MSQLSQWQGPSSQSAAGVPVISAAHSGWSRAASKQSSSDRQVSYYLEGEVTQKMNDLGTQETMSLAKLFQVI